MKHLRARPLQASDNRLKITRPVGTWLAWISMWELEIPIMQTLNRHCRQKCFQTGALIIALQKIRTALLYHLPCSCRSNEQAEVYRAPRDGERVKWEQAQALWRILTNNLRIICSTQERLTRPGGLAQWAPMHYLQRTQTLTSQKSLVRRWRLNRISVSQWDYNRGARMPAQRACSLKRKTLKAIEKGDLSYLKGQSVKNGKKKSLIQKWLQFRT